MYSILPATTSFNSSCRISLDTTVYCSIDTSVYTHSDNKKFSYNALQFIFGVIYKLSFKN